MVLWDVTEVLRKFQMVTGEVPRALERVLEVLELVLLILEKYHGHKSSLRRFHTSIVRFRWVP